MFIHNVIKSVLLVVLIKTNGLSQSGNSLKTAQLKNARVKEAYESKWPALQNDMKAITIDPSAYEVYIRAFKQEKLLQVWLKNSSNANYKLFKTYPICASSGVLGPKRKEGDGQVPEGFYKIDLFNPTSIYYLSMRISYPNASDIILKDGKNAGGAIMVHGNCVTIGCIPMTDEKIKEIYVLCLEAQNRNKPVHIDIFPAKLTDANLKILAANYSKSILTFWNNLKTGYDYFELHKTLPKVKTDLKGNYTFN